MSRLIERDELEALKLDETFRETLSKVRPYILSLTSPEEVELCKLWLFKLNENAMQRNLRNQYLTELFNQLKEGNVKRGIFSKEPPSGLLLPFSKSHIVRISNHTFPHVFSLKKSSHNLP